MSVELVSQTIVQLGETGAQSWDVGAVPWRVVVTVDDVGARRAVENVEPPAEGRVHTADASISGVHGSDDVKSRRERELRTVQQRDLLVAVLKEIQQFTKDARYV